MRGNIILGQVTSTKDPDQFGRVQVKLLAYGTPPTLPWLRMLMPYASASAGFVFLPEVGDEVAVLRGADDDVDGMLILGGIYDGGTNKTLYSNADGENITKSIKTRSGNHITWSDEEGKESITYETKASQKVVMTDDSGTLGFKLTNSDGTIELKLDKNGGELTIANGKNLTIKVAGNASIKADGSVEVQAGTTALVKAGTSATVQAGTEAVVKAGTNATVQAGVNCEIKGNAQVKITGGAMVEMSGPMVKIN